ncbi:MAG: THUMP domain-containing protein [Candidatus Caldarchaeum sp.]|nr:THUMP domain-containing protein [Candidatus Caldarchaeum sp.]MCS7138412.1 THUMP domain-containing protein [Candidatus Caldarchaeum sp.]MDW7978833.1 THUMP domain-containing protein [Candidatus Caldarchaeum sp.]MDW8359501.1 THUMP domain-containing protein [Candidatus Caldarchaeum sp.]
MIFFGTTFSGLEDVAAAEVSGLLGVEPERDVAKVFFKGSVKDCITLNLAGQTVNRVFLLLLRDKAESLGDVERLAGSLDYTEVIERGQSFAVRADRIGSHPFTSLDIAAAVGKAVIDSYAAASGVRLKVNLREPDVEIYCILRNEEFLVGVNTTGESLHRRWYRAGYHRAALSPTVANSMVRLSGWKRSQSLLDPFCGSGTIPLEAAIHGLCISPGLRRTLALEKLVFVEPEEVENIRETLWRRERRDEKLTIMGFDASPHAVAVAKSSLSSSGLGEAVRFAVGDVYALDRLLTSNVDRVVCNPPFGLRMRLRQPERFYVEAFKAVKNACPEASLTVLFSKQAVVLRALETAGYSVLSMRKILLGPITAYIATSV